MGMVNILTPKLLYFFHGLEYWIDPWADFHAQWLKLRAIRQVSVFWGLHDGWPHLGGQIPPKPSKLGANMHCRASQLRVNEDWRQEEWRHWRVTALQRKRCQLIFDDHCQTYGNLLPNCCQMPNHCNHLHWPKQTVYALLCTFSSIKLEISAVIIL